MRLWLARFARVQARTNGTLSPGRNDLALQSAMAELCKGGVFITVGIYPLPRDYRPITRLRDADFAVDRIIVESDPRR